MAKKSTKLIEQRQCDEPIHSERPSTFEVDGEGSWKRNTKNPIVLMQFLLVSGAFGAGAGKFDSRDVFRLQEHFQTYDLSTIWMQILWQLARLMPKHKL